MSQTETVNSNLGDLICNLKTAVTALECQHKLEMQKKLTSTNNQEQKPPTYLCVPIKEKKSHPSNGNKDKHPKKIESKEKTEKIKKKKSRKNVEREEDLCAFLSPEMRGGVLYTKCDCLIRNGLQDDCPLTLCQGQPDCLVKPWPECPPGKYFRHRHPEIYPSPAN